MYLRKQYNEAFNYYNRCYDIVTRIAGTNGPKAIHYTLLCAATKSYTADYIKAIPLYEHVLNLYKQRHEKTIEISLKLLTLYLKAKDSKNVFRIVDEIVISIKVTTKIHIE